MARCPPLGIASRALVARLVIAASSWAGSAIMGETSDDRFSAISIFSPSVRLNSRMIPDTSWFTSTRWGRSGCCLAKASSRRVSAAERGIEHTARQFVSLRVVDFKVTKQIGIADDNAQQVVEIVRHPAGETADGIHFLGPMQLLLQPRALELFPLLPC